MNGLADFVPGGFPLPWNPVLADSGIGDFVMGGFPLPQNPVFYPSASGSLPKAPPMPMALIGNGGGMGHRSDMIRGFSGVGCCDCGMGALTGDTIIPQASLPAFLQGDSLVTGVPTVYLAGGVLVALVVLPMLMGGGGRRRR